jgi:hypothetical protein
MKKVLILLLIFVQLVFINTKSLLAQEGSVRGLVMDKSGMSKIPGVYILNHWCPIKI